MVQGRHGPKSGRLSTGERGLATRGIRTLLQPTFEASTGRLNGLATLAGNWPALVLIQTADIAAGGSDRFVKLALAAQSASIVVLMIAMLAMHRNIAGRWQLVASCEAAAIGAAIAALAPNKFTFFFGLLASAWVTYASSTLRTALSARAGQTAPQAQGRVQTIMYVTIFLASVVYVAIGGNPTGWRIATWLLAAALAVEGARLAFLDDGKLPDPKNERQPALHQSVWNIFRFWPVMWAMLIVAVMYLMLGLYFADAQTELVHIHIRTSSASWIIAAVAGSRVLTLWMSRWMARIGEEHHGSALVWSALVVVIAAALATSPSFGPGLITGALALSLAGVLLQAAMNGSNPVIRAYIGNRSVDASTLLTIVAAGGQAIGTQIAAAVSWRAVAVGWVVGATVILILAIWTTLHRYKANTWDNTTVPPPAPDLPMSSTYWLSGTQRPDRKLRLRIRANGAGPLPEGYEPLAERDVGPDEIVRFKVPFDAAMDHQYWQRDGRVKFAAFRRRTDLAEWLRTRRWPHMRLLQRRSTANPLRRGPLLLLTGEQLDDCVTFDRHAQRWVVNTGRCRPLRCVLASGRGRWYRRVPFVATDGLVSGTIAERRVSSWQVVDRLKRPTGPVTTKAANLPVREITDLKLRNDAGGRWLISVDELDGIEHQIITELYFAKPRPACYVEGWGRHT